MKDSEKGVNHGYYITPGDIARRNPAWITQMADGVAPSVRVMFGRPPIRDVITGPMGCKMTVYLDNIRIVGKLGSSDDFETNDTGYARGCHGDLPQGRLGTAAISIAQWHVWCRVDLDEVIVIRTRDSVRPCR